jgi:hypothetical protein
MKKTHLDESLNQLKKDMAGGGKPKSSMAAAKPQMIVSWAEIRTHLADGALTAPVTLQLSDENSAIAFRRRIYRYVRDNGLPKVRVRLLKSKLIIDSGPVAIIVPPKQNDHD